MDEAEAAAAGGRVGSVMGTDEAEGAPSGSVETNLRSESVLVAKGLVVLLSVCFAGRDRQLHPTHLSCGVAVENVPD